LARGWKEIFVNGVLRNKGPSMKTAITLWNCVDFCNAFINDVTLKTIKL